MVELRNIAVGSTSAWLSLASAFLTRLCTVPLPLCAVTPRQRGGAHAFIAHRDNRPQFGAAPRLYTVEQKTLQETQEPQPAGKPQAPHG
jgi:hypothetical protein